MKNPKNRKVLDGGMKAIIWARDERLCKKCHQVVYRTFSPRGLIHHIDFNRRNNQGYNLVLLYNRCHRVLHNLYSQDFYEYGWIMELITKAKCVLPYGNLSNGYRYSHTRKYINRLEQEKNLLDLPRKDLELLEYLRTLEKELLVEHNKAELMSQAKDKPKDKEEGKEEK